MSETVQIVGYLNLVAFAALGVVAVRQWRGRRDRAGLWAALCFGALGAVVVVGRAVPDHPHGVGEHLLQRLDIAALVVFPFLLYRFTTAFGRPSVRLERFVGSMTTVLVVWTFALPRFPASGEDRPGWFWAYLVGFLVHWSVLSVVVALRLWKAGRGQPTVARRRMHMLALAAAAITAAIFLVVAASDENSPLALAGNLAALVSAATFLLGLAPPAVVRMIWRRPEQERLQSAIADLITLATSEEEIAARVLAPMAEIVGARGIAIRREDGREIGVYFARGVDPAAQGDSKLVETPMPGGSLAVWTTPYAPFFGREEFQLLRTLGSLTGLAFDRVRLFAHEHAMRLALERANQVKTNFVALAAHELRTPVTSIHGFVQTLNRLGDRLDAEQRRELQDALEQQTRRMAQLVEQLLDLSRLDAEAIEIEPEGFDVRRRLEELVTTAAGAQADAVRLEVPSGLEARADPEAFDRIVSNLVTNAFRYGEPPVIVSAERTDRHFRVSVEDRGPGVEPEFIPDLFERFSRSEPARTETGGTGLGLAIARSYALAHDGDLLYHEAEPHGARFELILPAEPGRRADTEGHRHRVSTPL